MSTEDLLVRLARLDARDRDWLLGELSPTMRRDLAALLDDEPAAAAAAAAQPVATTSWETLDPQRLAALLEGEAAWLVSAAIRGTEQRWRERLMHSLGSRQRHEIELADRSGARLGARAIQCVLESCRTRLGFEVAAPLEPEVRGGFASLLDRMKGRPS